MNKVDTLKHLADCVRLSELYIRQNNISSMEELHYLAGTKGLLLHYLAYLQRVCLKVQKHIQLLEVVISITEKQNVGNRLCLKER